MTTSVILAALHDVEREILAEPAVSCPGVDLSFYVRRDHVRQVLRAARADHDPDVAAEIEREEQDALENALADEEREGAA